MKGKVYLVGAGPGDFKLISVKGLSLISLADVLIYDRLVNEKLLTYRKKDCVLIYAGKSPDKHFLTQSAINELLVKYASEGKMVVRLKGGDPFILGRGGEECEDLERLNLPFEVVPGISSFYSALAYAGIPLTHRDFCSSFHVFSGHEAEGLPHFDFETIAKLEGTLVFLMGMKNLPHIVSGLLAHGFDKNTPAALVMWGTRAEQREAFGTVVNIVEKAREQQIENPAVIVIGHVVKKHEAIDWQRFRPLFKKKILTVRTKKQSGNISDYLYNLGAEVTEFPLIDIMPPDYRDMDEAISHIDRYNWLVFTSENGVNFFLDRLMQSGKDVRVLSHTNLFAIGKRTETALRRRGLCPDFVPDTYDSAQSAKLLRQLIRETDSVLMPVSSMANDNIVEAVKGNCARCDKICAYITKKPSEVDETVFHDIRNAAFDAIVFASSSQAKNYFELFGTDTFHMKIVSIGAMTSAELTSLGIHVHATAENATIEELGNAVVRAFC